MSTELMGDYLNDADPTYLMKAVCIVFDRYERSKLKPGSDHWVMETDEYRAKLVTDVKNVWESLSGGNVIWFPYRDSFVARQWALFRRMNADIRAKWVAASLDGNEDLSR